MQETQRCDAMTDITDRDVDRGWAWVVLSASALCLALADVLQISVGIFQVEFLEAFSGSQGYVALICAICVGGQTILGPVAGVMADLLSHRVTAMLGGALQSVALLLASFSPDLSTLLLFFGVLTGIGAGLCYTPSVTVISTYFHKYRTAAYGITLGAPGVGVVVGPHLLRWLIDGYGWRYAMAVQGGLMAQVCVLAALFYPRNPPSLTSSGCCSPCGRLPPADGHAQNTSGPTKDADTCPSNDDLDRTEQEVILGSRTNLEVKTGSRTELQILLGSRTEMDVKTESRTELAVKVGSRTDLQVDAGSRADLEAKAGSGTGMQSRPAAQASVFGSLVLNQSVECLKEQDSESTSLGFRQRVTRLLCRKFTWIICLSQLLVTCGHSINIVLYPAFAQSVGAASTDIPVLLTVYGVTIIVVRVAAGFAFSAIPERLTHAFLGLQVALAVVFGFLPVYGVSLPALFVGVVMVGMTFGPSYALLSPIILRYVELSDLSIAFGLVMMSCGTAFLLGPTIAGVTYDIFQSYSISYYIAGATVGAGTLPILFLLLTKDHGSPEAKDDRQDKLLSTHQKDCNTSAPDTGHETTNGDLSDT